MITSMPSLRPLGDPQVTAPPPDLGFTNSTGERPDWRAANPGDGASVAPWHARRPWPRRNRRAAPITTDDGLQAWRSSKRRRYRRPLPGLVGGSGRPEAAAPARRRRAAA
jgi:hypothetical protein